MTLFSLEDYDKCPPSECRESYILLRLNVENGGTYEMLKFPDIWREDDSE